MTLIYGTHGTSRSFAEDIRNNGFDRQRLAPGRHGSGVYLWAYDLNTSGTKDRAIKIAKSWHSLRFAKGVYNECSKKSCAVLDCKANVILLDIVNHENANIFRTYIEASMERIEKLRLTGKNIEEQKATRLYGLFVKLMSQQHDKSYNAVHVLTTSPIKERVANWQRFQQVDLESCYVIHDTNAVNVLDLTPVP
ncbi:hypothetical protein AB6D20_010640 [Vibrio splendidus]